MAILFLGSAVTAEAQEIAYASLADLSLEQLIQVQVSSVSRTEQSLSSAAAAVAVVTSEAIERSGATTIPDVLRSVPGIHVARQSAGAWAVSARGFSSANSRNLLVLSDTRSIYTPLFSGVYWDAQDYLMRDIERIEVVRGPGAALWGSNAVNGVVSITTKSARDTQGTYTHAIVGTEERGVAARYGGASDSDTFYRVFMKHSEHDGSYAPAAVSDDHWRMSHAGFRADWGQQQDDAFTLQGDVYDGRIGQLVPMVRVIGRPGPEGNLEAEISGGNLLGRWKHRISDRSDLQLRAYYDRTHRDDPSFTDTLSTADIDFQMRTEMGQRHELLWGVNYRQSQNKNRSKGIFIVEPEASKEDLVSMFVQDKIKIREKTELSLGTKLEYNDFSGFEVQPSVRVAWHPTPVHAAWAAISRAVRVPTRYERDVAIDVGTTPTGEIYRLVGNREFESEEMISYEVGHRWLASERVSVDVAVFHNQYEGLSSVEIGDSFQEGEWVVIPLVAENLSEGHSRGAEALITFKPSENWRVTANYSYLDMQIDKGGLDLNFEELIEGSTPRHQLNINSSYDWRQFQFDLQLRGHSKIRSIPEIRTGATIPGYVELDVRMARRLNEHVEISLVGRNLLDHRHPEFGDAAIRGEVERSVFGKLTFDF